MHERVVVDYKSFLESDRYSSVVLVKQQKRKKERTERTTVRGMNPKPDEESDSDSSSDSDTEDEENANKDGGNGITSNKGIGQEAHDRTEVQATPPTHSKKDAFEKLHKSIAGKYGIKGGMDELLRLSPPRIPAYGLKSKRWSWVLIERLKPVIPSEEAFNQLQMNGGTKRLIRALVEGSQSPQADTFDDTIQGKGKGLVLLLHG